MAATPPPAGRVHTPPAPLHGAMHDSYEPYSPRRSRRVLERQQNSPKSDFTAPRVRQRVNRAATPPAKTVSTRTASQTFSPPSSPASPRIHKSSPKKNSPQRSGGPNTQAHNKLSSLLHPSSSIDPTTSLPTPSKTPRKKYGPSQVALSSTSRVLFPNRPATAEEAMPTPRKGKHSRKHSAYGLDGSLDEQDADASDNIEIYTDSKERVPVKDRGEENPFVNREESDGKSKRPSKRRRGQSSSDKRMEEAAENGEGMIYVFRGKRVFRTFDDSANGAAAAETSSTAVQRAAGAAAQKPLTRSNFKPRLLFPTEAQAKAREEDDEDDLEAVTDIDERLVHPRNGTDQKLLSSEDEGKERKDEEVVTPVKQDFSPATPPSTGRATRSKAKKGHETSPLTRTSESEVAPDPTPTQRKKPSPFDKWPRAKAGSRSVSGTKREAEPMEKGDAPAGKRTRSGAASTS